MASHVERVREGYEAFNRGDLDGFLDFLAPDVEWLEPSEGAQGDVHNGREEVRRFIQLGLEAWGEYRAEPEQILEAGADRVLVLVHARARGRASGLEMEAPVAHLITLLEGRVTRLEMFAERSEALAAAGLGP